MKVAAVNNALKTTLGTILPRILSKLRQRLRLLSALLGASQLDRFELGIVASEQVRPQSAARNVVPIKEA